MDGFLCKPGLKQSLKNLNDSHCYLLLFQEVDLVHSLRDHNKRLEDGLQESNTKLKIKMHKLKVLKQQLKELQESKQLCYASHTQIKVQVLYLYQGLVTNEIS